MFQKNCKAYILTLFFVFLTFLLLRFPKESLFCSFTGLQLWFNKMIPTLLPFMILSGIMIRLNLTERFVRLVNPIFKPLFHISGNGVYVIIIGFLCGFPLGAKVIADLYQGHKISKREASFLLSFCNNIGSIYFISFVLPTLGLQKRLPYLAGMYAIPFFYGICQNLFSKVSFSVQELCSAESNMSSPTLLDALDDSIMSSLYSIARLGGYMIVFNILNVIPNIFLYSGAYSAVFLRCFFEITSGISFAGTLAPLTVLILLPFGGLSCIAQTYSMIKETDLSIKKYLMHKLLLSGITAVYYYLWYLFFPSSFLL